MLADGSLLFIFLGLVCWHPLDVHGVDPAAPFSWFQFELLEPVDNGLVVDGFHDRSHGASSDDRLREFLYRSEGAYGKNELSVIYRLAMQ